jgi:hypothetical protein
MTTTGAIAPPASFHPAWCDRAFCTADPAAATIAGFRGWRSGEHRSAPVELTGLSDFAGPLTPLTGPVTMSLSRLAAPWTTTTFLWLAMPGATPLAVPLNAAAGLLDQISKLLTRAVGGDD